jgi:chemotaxis protein methyltransferase CheR
MLAQAILSQRNKTDADPSLIRSGRQRRPQPGVGAIFAEWGDGAAKPTLHFDVLVSISSRSNPMRDNEFEFIRSQVYERSRISLSPDKRELVAARLGKRLVATNAANMGEYLAKLRAPDGEQELVNLVDVILTHHTFFFREKDHFEFVRNVAVPELLARLGTERWPALRAWSAACSSGEESYSLAITLEECLRDKAWPWHIEATDISEGILEQARSAIYSKESVDKLPQEVCRAHFQKGVGRQAGNYRVKAGLRSRVSFHQFNLLGQRLPFADRFHIIFCRNVMIYFDRDTQQELIHRLTRQLVPGGYLMVGHSESLMAINHSLCPARPAIYRKPLAA